MVFSECFLCAGYGQRGNSGPPKLVENNFEKLSQTIRIGSLVTYWILDMENNFKNLSQTLRIGTHVRGI